MEWGVAVTMQPKSDKVILALIAFTGLAVLGCVMPSVHADKSDIEASSGLSASVHVGKSDIGANASSDVESSANAGTGMSDKVNSGASASAARSQDESHENYHASSNESEPHENYKNNYEKITANSDDEFTVQSGRHLYKPGDNVTVEGSLWSSLIASLGNVTTVSVQVADNGGNIVYSGDAQIGEGGEYAATFTLPSDAKQGAYTIKVNADASADVLGTLSVKAKNSLSSSAKMVVVNPHAVQIKAGGKDFDVELASNSTTVGNLTFDQQDKKLSFVVGGDSGTKGVTQVTIPKSLLNGDMTVMIDGHAMAQSDIIKTADTDTETTLELNYHHSTHQIDIVGTNAVPEFGQIASMVLAFSVLSVVLLMRRRQL